MADQDWEVHAAQIKNNDLFLSQRTVSYLYESITSKNSTKSGLDNLSKNE